MPVNPLDQPLDKLRDDTVDQLIMNYGHGRLSLEAFQRRLDEAFDARDQSQLMELTRDLELTVDSGYVEKKREELEFQYADDGEVDDVEYIVDVFGGSDRGGLWTAPRELRIFTLFGGSNVDFSEARFSSQLTRVRMLCLFGGVDIFVPEGINTTVRVFSIFGGVSNKAPSTTDRHAPRLLIEGLVIFGGGDVKLKRTFRERLMEFADNLRGFFTAPGAPQPPSRPGP